MPTKSASVWKAFCDGKLACAGVMALSPASNNCKQRLIAAALIALGVLCAFYVLPGSCTGGSDSHAACSIMWTAMLKSSPEAPKPPEGPLIFRYAAGKNWTNFRALRSDAISTRRCVDYWALGREAPGRGPYSTCEFANLYVDAAGSEDHVIRFVYLHEVDPAANETEATAEVDAVRQELQRVKAVAQYVDETPQVLWDVVGLRAEVPSDDATGVMSCTVAAAPPVFANGTNIVQPSDPQAPAGGCWANAPQPAVFMQRPPPQNIGHYTWDGLLPVMGALMDLGLTHLYDQLQLIVYDHTVHAAMGYVWPSEVVRQVTFDLFRHPVFNSEIRWQAAALSFPTVRFSKVVIGQGGRSAHDFPPEYALRDAPKHIVWEFRQAALRVMNLTSEDRQRAQADPLRIVLVQKPEKRVITNIADVVASARGQLAADGFTNVVIDVIDWTKGESSYQHEVRTLLKTDVLMSVDGTGANNLFFMPPGAVFISLGVRDPYGFGNQADFLFASVDHIAVLYHPPLAAGGHNDDIVLDVPVTSEHILRAARLVRAGFKRPVPWKLNHSPSGYAVQHLFHKYLPLNMRGWDMYVPDSSAFMHKLRIDPVGMWNQWVAPSGIPPPANITDEVVAAAAEYKQLHESWELSVFATEAGVAAYHSPPGASSPRLRKQV